MSTAKLRVLLFSVCLLIGGCGAGQSVTVSYDAAQNRTTYETGLYTVATGKAANYASSKDVEMRAVARCRGRNCSPDDVRLIFTVSGSQQLALSGVGGYITADGTTFDWTTTEAGTNLSGGGADDDLIEVVGRFAVVDLSLNQFRKIATASSVSGSIGGMSLQMGSNVQSGFQKLLRKIDQRKTENRSSNTER